MRILHSGDWHLGRVFHGLRLTEDQSHILDDFVDLARSSRADVVLISGDIYDRAVPPPEAVRLFDDVLHRLVEGVGVPVVAIAGNHDSPERVGFASRLLSRQMVHLRGTLDGYREPIVLGDEHGPVEIYAIPYAEPALARSILGDASITSHADAMRALVASLPRAPGVRRVLVTHAFVMGGEESESERLLSVGGADAVPCDVFSDLSFVALGHLHKRQILSGGSVHYPGSLLKYSFSEVENRKGVSLVEMDAQGHCRVECIPLRVRRDLRLVEGLLDDLLKGPAEGESREDYLLVRLLDRAALLDPLARLREIYPNVLHLERTAYLELNARAEPRRDLQDGDVFSLFGDFAKAVSGEPLSDQESALLTDLVAQWERRERESAGGGEAS